MGEQTNVGEVLKAGTEVVGKVFSPPEMDMVDRGLDILSKGKDISLDTIERGLEIKENYKAQKYQRKNEELHRDWDIIKKYYDDTAERGMTPDPEVMDKFEKKLIRQIGEKEQKSKDSGSKVKEGAFAECSIEMFDDEAGIIVDRDTQEVVMLTSDNIASCKLEKHKKRGVKLNTYYYYHITFRDGQKCLVRMRKKYVDAMLNSMKDTDGVQDDSLE